MIDTSIVRVHQRGACIANNSGQHIGRSRGGLTSKIHVVVDGNGLPVQLGLTGGQAHDNRLCSVLLRQLVADVVGFPRIHLPSLRQPDIGHQQMAKRVTLGMLKNHNNINVVTDATGL
jgi:hypothetical protein